MSATSPYIEPLVKRLSRLNINRIILFGSYAYGNPDKDSDIDLLVVTNDTYTPQTYDAYIQLQVKIRNAISDISQKAPVDLIVYTEPMYEKFKERNSAFAKEILTRGHTLYERYNKSMA